MNPRRSPTRSILPSFLLLFLAACGKSEPETAKAKPTAPKDSSGGARAKLSFPEGEVTYHFGTNPAVTDISCSTSTSVINIQAKTKYATGSATINFQEDKGSCRISVPVATLTTGDDSQSNAMKGSTYLDGKKYPTIEFVSEKAVRKGDRTWELTGKFTLHGITKDITVEVDVVPISEKTGKRLGEGQWARVVIEFPVDMREYAMALGKQYVGDVDPIWRVSILMSGTTARPAEPIAVKTREPNLKEMRLRRPAKEPDKDLPGEVYKIGRPKQFVSIQVTSVTEAEVITAETRIVGGYLGVDEEKGIGEIRMNFSIYTLMTRITERDEHLQGKEWLNGEEHRHIFFKAKDVKRIKEDLWEANGELTLRGVTRPLSAKVRMRKHSVEFAKKHHWGNQPVLEFDTEFKVRLSDFGIKIPERAILSVKDELRVQMKVAATRVSK